MDQDVAGLDLARDGSCSALRLKDGSLLEAADYCVAAGAWLRGLYSHTRLAPKGPDALSLTTAVRRPHGRASKGRLRRGLLHHTAR